MNIDSILQGYGFNESAGNFENNPTSQRAAVTSAFQKHSLGTDVLGKNITMDERQSHHMYNKIFDENGKTRSVAPMASNYQSDLKMMQNDVAKTHGKLTGPGASTGIGFGWQGNRVASRGAHLASAVTDSARLTAEGGLNALGIMTRQQKLQFKQGNMLMKGMAVAPAAFSLYNNVSTILDGGDIGDALAMNLTAVGGMVGFHAGKSLAGAIGLGGAAKVAPGVTGALKMTGGKMRIASQFAGGLIGGAVGTAAISALTYGAQDLTSSESSIAKAARSYSKLSELASVEQNRGTLTMRQKALQQLSQSALNDRGSLLGNEAAILKNLL